MFNFNEIADILKPQVESDAHKRLDGIIGRIEEPRTRIDDLNNYDLTVNIASQFLNLDGVKEVTTDVETDSVQHLEDGSSIMTINVAAFADGDDPALLIGELIIHRSTAGHISVAPSGDRPTLVATPGETYELHSSDRGDSGQSIMFSLWTDYCRNLYFDVNAS